MATQSRNRVVPKDDQKEFVLNCIKEDGGLILSKKIGKMAQERFGLSHPMTESKITNIVNSLRLEDGYWQIHGSKKGYKWSESDVEYQTWKSEYQSKIETMIRCLHKVECSYIKDVNAGVSKFKLGKNFIPKFNFLPSDLEWEIIPFTFERLEEPIPKPKPLIKIEKKTYEDEEYKTDNGIRLSRIAALAKEIRKEGEPWKDAQRRAAMMYKLNNQAPKPWSEAHPIKSSMLKDLFQHFNKNKNNKK